MTIPNEKVLSIFCIPFKKTLKICATGVFIALMLMPCIFFLGIKLPLRLYKSSEQTIDGIEVKTILYWTKMWDDDTFYFGGGDIFKNCEVSTCRATTDRWLRKIQDFDAIVFHGIEINAFDLPPDRSKKQKYVFVDLESPISRPLLPALVPNGFYNWTMTYRRDSDIPRTYGHIMDSVTKDIVYPIWARTNAVATHTAEEDLGSPPNYARFKGNYERSIDRRFNNRSMIMSTGKRKSVAWFVSHCDTDSLRDIYVAELKRYIDVDIYGKCGSLSCPSENKECYRMLESRYYFYLAFENSLCEDYVTEKLYKVMGYDVVPIVYGAANYTEFAPPGSYLNVVNFPSPKHLAEHLRYLMENLEEYAKFYWWKKHYFVDPAELSHTGAACQMCKMLHEQENYTSSSVLDLTKWWSVGKCLNAREFLAKITRYEAFIGP